MRSLTAVVSYAPVVRNISQFSEVWRDLPDTRGVFSSVKRAFKVNEVVITFLDITSSICFWLGAMRPLIQQLQTFELASRVVQVLFGIYLLHTRNDKHLNTLTMLHIVNAARVALMASLLVTTTSSIYLGMIGLDLSLRAVLLLNPSER